MSTNEYGLDVSYFESKFKRILSEIDRYTPDELARECARMASAADESVLLENEFLNTTTIKKLTDLAKEVGMRELRIELIKATTPIFHPHIEGVFSVVVSRINREKAEKAV